MSNRHTLFTDVQEFYTDLVACLETAESAISMTYLAFDNGKWARKIARILANKAASGLSVRLMVDEIGQITDAPFHILQNQSLVQDLCASGVQVDFFRPAAPGLSQSNRMHCKIAAIDGRTAFVGGSNIGDHYTLWSDTNLRIDGELQNAFHQVFDYLRSFTQPGTQTPRLNLSDLRFGDDQLWLTIPGRRLDIRRALLKLILEADRYVYLRTWYFLPEKEILDALCAQAEAGVRVNILLSHRTRVRPIDFANHIHVKRLTHAGGDVYRYVGQYMHAKLAWNNKGEVLFGSANLDAHSMRSNFESCLEIHDEYLARDLRHAFERDIHSSLPQTLEGFRARSFVCWMLSHACNLAAPWL